MSLSRPPPSIVPGPDSDSPPTAGHYDQEFLFHLYRGSELLSSNSVDEAKAELERAIKLQPEDTEGQSLLGVVYFRLGMYPRAIQIFEQLEEACPQDITPRVNLALCFLKTGQTEAARIRLEHVVLKAPGHKRAWGYLGLVYQRFGDFRRAKEAFEKADRPKLAERMNLLIEQIEQAEDPAAQLEELEGAPARTSGPPSLSPALLRSTGSLPPLDAPPLPTDLKAPEAATALAAVAAPDPAPTDGPNAAVQKQALKALAKPATPVATVPPLAPEPPLEPRLPVALGLLARTGEVVFPESPRVVLDADGRALVRVQSSFAVRPQWVSAMSHERRPFEARDLRRQAAGKTTLEPLGGAAPLVKLVGNGGLVLCPQPGTHLLAINAETEPVYVKETHLVGFEGEVHYETGRLDPAAPGSETVVKLTGPGVVLLRRRGTVASLTVSSNRSVSVRNGQVIGWLGQLLPRVTSGVGAPAGMAKMVGFSGHGSVLTDMG